jgi:sulfate/thiosulfate transport system permease protein
MTVQTLEGAPGSSTVGAPTDPGPTRHARRGGGISPLSLGVAMLWLSLIVLLPLAAIVVKSTEDGFGGFWAAVTTDAALDAFGRRRGAGVTSA